MRSPNFGFGVLSDYSRLSKGLGSDVDKANVDLMIHVLPFLRRTKLHKEFFKGTFVRRLVFEPSQKIESLRFGQISAVMKATGDVRQISHADAHMSRLLFENSAPLVLG